MPEALIIHLLVTQRASIDSQNQIPQPAALIDAIIYPIASEIMPLEEVAIVTFLYYY